MCWNVTAVCPSLAKQKRLSNYSETQSEMLNIYRLYYGGIVKREAVVVASVCNNGFSVKGEISEGLWVNIVECPC